MAVFRIEKTRDYTVMSNHHLKNKNLTLKAKGLLSVMLSLPETWDYTLKGLAIINREGVDAIREAVRELEKAGIAYQVMDVNEHRELVARYGIQQAPTLIVRHGEQVEKLVNASTIKKFATSQSV